MTASPFDECQSDGVLKRKFVLQERKKNQLKQKLDAFKSSSQRITRVIDENNFKTIFL